MRDAASNMPAKGDLSDEEPRYDVVEYALPDGVDPADIEFDQETYAVPAGTGETVVTNHRSILTRHRTVRTLGIVGTSAIVIVAAVVFDVLLLGILVVAALVIFDRIIRSMYMTVPPEVVAADVDHETAVEDYGAEIAEGDPFQ